MSLSFVTFFLTIITVTFFLYLMTQVRKLRSQLERLESDASTAGAAGEGGDAAFGHADDNIDDDVRADESSAVVGQAKGAAGGAGASPSAGASGVSSQGSRGASGSMGPGSTSTGTSKSVAPPAFVLAPLPPPTAAHEDAVRQIILSGFGDHVARLSSQVRLF
jgi:hypothetical protein